MSSFNVPCRECDTIIRIKHDFVSRVERELAKCPKCGTAVAEDTLIIFSRIFASDQDDLYHVLGVIDDPTNEEILSAYRRIIKHVHPDAWNIVSQETKRATLLDAATKRVNEIYETASSDQYQKKRRQEAKRNKSKPEEVPRRNRVLVVTTVAKWWDTTQVTRESQHVANIAAASFNCLFKIPLPKTTHERAHNRLKM